MDKTKEKGPSRIRRIYIAKLIGRCFVLIFCACLCWNHLLEFEVMNYFCASYFMGHLDD